MKKISQPGGRDIEIEFGSCPRIADKIIYPGEREYDYGYDAAKRLETITDPMKGQFKIARDKSGRITGLTDANQNQTSFTYNAAGRLTGKSYADGTSVKINYAQSGLTNSRTNARGIVKTYTHNDKGQVTTIRYSDGTPGVTLSYDVQGRLNQVEDGSGVTQYTYAATGELASIDGPLSNDAIGFVYDELYRVGAVTIDGKTNASYEYDSLGRPSKVIAQGKTFEFSYTDEGDSADATVTYPNGITQSVELDSIGDLKALRYQKGATLLSDFGYEFDVAGDLVGLHTSEPMPFEPGSYKTTYNSVNQIKTFNGEEGVFTYDADGNLTSGLLAGGETFTAAYDAENRLTSIAFTYSGH